MKRTSSLANTKRSASELKGWPIHFLMTAVGFDLDPLSFAELCFLKRATSTSIFPGFCQITEEFPVCNLSQHIRPEHPLVPCVGKWERILNKRAAERKNHDEENQERADEKLRLKAALEQVERDQQVATENNQLVENQYSEAIAKRHENVNIAMSEITKVTTQLREAEKKAATAAAKATVARQQVKVQRLAGMRWF